MSFGENLAFLRKKSGVTQEQLAETLEVTRQSVSKWESGASFPEMETLLKISEMFSCGVDTLLKGDARSAAASDTHDYDRHMNFFLKMISAGVFLVIFGVSLLLFFEGAGGGDAVPVMVFLAFVVFAVFLFIVGGIRHGEYVKAHPHIEPFYSAGQAGAYGRIFPVLIAGPVALILIGVILVVGSESLPVPRGFGPEFYTAVFMFIVSVSAGILVYAGIQKSKYNIDEYNRENAFELESQKDGKASLEGSVCGIIMLLATALFLLLGFLKNSWHLAAVIFPVAGILCAVAGTLIAALRRKR